MISDAPKLSSFPPLWGYGYVHALWWWDDVNAGRYRGLQLYLSFLLCSKVLLNIISLYSIFEISHGRTKYPNFLVEAEKKMWSDLDKHVIRMFQWWYTTLGPILENLVIYTKTRVLQNYVNYSWSRKFVRYISRSFIRRLLFLHGALNRRL